MVATRSEENSEKARQGLKEQQEIPFSNSEEVG